MAAQQLQPLQDVLHESASSPPPPSTLSAQACKSGIIQQYGECCPHSACVWTMMCTCVRFHSLVRIHPFAEFLGTAVRAFVEPRVGVHANCFASIFSHMHRPCNAFQLWKQSRDPHQGRRQRQDLLRLPFSRASLLTWFHES